MIRLAHIADPHLGAVHFRLRDLPTKRFPGYLTWMQRRRAAHSLAILATIVADLRTQACDHIVCTGDLCHLGLPGEWDDARRFLASLGPLDAISLVPGNHDAYVRGSLEGLLAACAPWITGDDGRAKIFPYLRRRGDVALVGLSSALPTGIGAATGALGPAQLAAAETLLGDLARAPDPPCRVVLIHHPPYPGATGSKRALTDAAAFTAMIARVGADLVLHGHNHTSMMAFLDGPSGKAVPVVGAPSASATSLRRWQRAAYHLFTIERTGTGYAVSGVERGVGADGAVMEFGPIDVVKARTETARPSHIPVLTVLDR